MERKLTEVYPWTAILEIVELTYNPNNRSRNAIKAGVELL
jgi:hypothetical protein